MKRGFLPITKEDMQSRGWEQLDFLFISGDAYVDHPSFGHAIITRVLEKEGFKVGIVAQPDWKSIDDFIKLGEPKFGVLISSGNIDSMVNHYTAAKKKRSEDLYTPGGKSGKRPDRAVIVYSNRAREAFPNIPIVIGGIEASLRRFAHYDYWDNKVRRSVLLDSRADLLIYGMGEKAIVDVAHRLAQGTKVDRIRDIKGTAFLSDSLPDETFVNLPGFEEIKEDTVKYAGCFMRQYKEQDAFGGKILVQKHGDKFVIQNTPSKPLSVSEMDAIYSLPYQRTYHPDYQEQGGVPAIKEVQFSITSHRGCYGGCSFCALTFHQGRIIQPRSHASVINEAKNMTWDPDFKGYIHDVGGPTANFRNPACEKQLKSGACREKQCLFPRPCKNLKVDHSDYLKLLRQMRKIPGIKKVFIRSGIRYDYLNLDENLEFFKELCEHHVSGQLKVAPEHVSRNVLQAMGKPEKKVYDEFTEKFYTINKQLRKEQYLVPYLMSSHPGSTLKDAVELAEYMRDIRYSPEQVQDFYPTPGSLSTCMFYTGLDPRTMKKIHVPRSTKEKAMQRALLQYRRPENYELVYEALVKAGREDLIGFDRKCLIRPRKTQKLLDQKKQGIDIKKKGTAKKFTKNNKRSRK